MYPFNKLFRIVCLFFLLGRSFNGHSQGDNCSNAMVLTNLTNYCSSSGSYSNVGSTQSANAVPNCWPNASNDVWFQFTAVGDGVNITINGAPNGTLSSPDLALYSGTCSSLSPIGCAVPDFIHPDYVSLFNSNLTIGNIYFIRVNGSQGTFQLCINNFVAVPTTNQDCMTASTLCSKDPISCNSFNGAGSNQNEVDNTCIPAEMESSWYTWTAANNGTLTLAVTPYNGTDDIDFFVFELGGGSCSNMTVPRCCSSSCLGPGGSTGLSMTETDTEEIPGCDLFTENGYVQYINMIAGHTYGIFINNVSGQGGFNLSFGGSGDFQGPTSDFTVSDTVVCGTGVPIIFTNTSANYNNLLWHFGSSASIDTTSATSPQTVSFSTGGLHTVALETYTTNGCVVVSYKTILVLAPPQPVLPNDTLICPGNNLILDAGNANSGDNYLWQPGGQTTETIAVSTSGVYSVTLSNACYTVSDSVNIGTFTQPTVSIGGAQTICIGDSILLTANTTAAFPAYSWLPGGETMHAIMVSDSGVYMVTVNDGNCYVISDSVKVEEEDCSFTIPNIFSPNGDNINDVFYINGLEKHPNSNLTVFNRWGNKVYESINYQNNWDGSKLSDGIYYYVLIVGKDISGMAPSSEEGSKYGFFSIVR